MSVEWARAGAPLAPTRPGGFDDTPVGRLPTGPAGDAALAAAARQRPDAAPAAAARQRPDAAPAAVEPAPPSPTRRDAVRRLAAAAAAAAALGAVAVAAVLRSRRAR